MLPFPGGKEYSCVPRTPLGYGNSICPCLFFSMVSPKLLCQLVVDNGTLITNTPTGTCQFTIYYASLIANKEEATKELTDS